MEISQKKIFIIIIYILLICTEIAAQKNRSTSNNYEIKFIRSVASLKDIESDNFFNKISNLILGDENSQFQKPVSLIAKDSVDLIILDQGLNGLVSINTQKGDFDLIE